MIKKAFLWALCLLALPLSLFAQSRGFVYQSQLVDDKEQAVKNAQITLRLTLHNATEDMYREIHTVTTNDNGVFGVVVGQGQAELNEFSALKWGKEEMYIRVEVDRENNGNYTLFAQNEILAVPFAYYAYKPGEVAESEDGAQDKVLDVTDKNFFIINTEKGPDTLLTVTKEGAIGVGTTTPRTDVEFAVNKRLHLSTEEWHLSKSGVLSLQAKNDLAKPSIVWYDEFEKPHAALTVYDRERVDPKHFKEFAIETDDGKGNMLPRITIPYDKEKTTINVYNSDFNINGGTFEVGQPGGGGRTYYYGDAYFMRRFIIGDTSNISGSFPTKENVNLEINKSKSSAEVLIKSAADAAASINMQRGEHTWSVSTAEEDLVVRYNGEERMRLTADGKVGIGTEKPQSKLDVAGEFAVDDVVKTSGQTFALYFDAAETVKAGDVVGINSEGLARKWQPGDNYVGIATDKAGYILGEKKESDSANQVLVAVMGQIETLNPEQVKVETFKVYTLSGELIGYKTGNMYVLK